MDQKISIFERFPELETIPSHGFPSHVLIIPDGNGRWAQQEKKFVLQGHKKGAEQIDIILHDLSELQEIKIVTLWAFSSDNWKRSADEVKGLMFLIQSQVEQKIKDVKERNARFIHLGRKDRIPKSLLDTIEAAEQDTKNNLGQIICLAIDFGGDDQQVRILEKLRSIPSDTKIDLELLWQLRDGNGEVPPADLLIRSASEKRTSDIGWLNGASTELYFIDKYFPDVTTADIVKALVDFSKRERRFGARK